MEEMRDQLSQLAAQVQQLALSVQQFVASAPTRQEMQDSDDRRVDRDAYEVARQAQSQQLREMREDIAALQRAQDGLRQGVSRQRIELDGRLLGWLVAGFIGIVTAFVASGHIVLH
jgi:hypothetical protein